MGGARVRRTLSFTVAGVAAPQGSKSLLGHGALVESSKRVAPWRADVRAAAMSAMGDGWQPLTGAVDVDIEVFLPRPKSHYGTGRNAQTVKHTAPTHPTGRNSGDADKIARAILDALTSAGVWRDDSQVVDLGVSKQWATFTPQAKVFVWGEP